MKIHALSVAATLVLSAASMQASAANDGVIEFVGAITDVTCTVEGEAPGGGTARKDVDLGGIAAARLDTAGKRANLTGFFIKIGSPGETACTNGRKAMVAFDPTSAAIDRATGRLNVDTGGATQVQIEVTDSAGNPLNVYTDKSEQVVIADNQALIPLAAQFYATGAAGEGEVKSRVGFMVEYAE